MSVDSSTSQTCHHPARDIVIVSLGATSASLIAAVVTMGFHGAPLAVLGAAGTVLVGAFSAGMSALGHLRRNA